MRSAALVVAIVVGLTACGSRADGTSDDTTDDTAAATEPAGAAVAVPDILDFEAPLVGGATFDARTLAGMPTVFWFWAPT